MKNQWLIVFTVLIFFLGCNEKTSSEPVACKSVVEDNIEVKTEITEYFVEEPLVSENIEKIFGGERRSYFLGTVYDTTVNIARVNVHNYPSLQSEILFRISKNTRITVIGSSREEQTIDGYTGRWLLVAVPNPFVDLVEIFWEPGWIFSKYVNNGNIVPNEIEITGLGPEPEHSWVQRRLYGRYIASDTEVQFFVHARQWPNQAFWTFAWLRHDKPVKGGL